MDNNLEHNDWKDDAPHLSRLPKVNPFAVPEQYFDNLSDRIQAAVFVDDLKSKVGLPVAQIPEGYFQQLHDEINAKITLDALNLSKEDGFAVPEGYFSGVNANIINKIAGPEEGTSKVRKLWPNRVTRYAAAACLVLISGFAVYLNQDSLFNNSDSTPTTTVSINEDPTLWDIDEDTIMEQVDGSPSGTPTNTSATSAELEDYILNHYTQYEIASNL